LASRVTTSAPGDDLRGVTGHANSSPATRIRHRRRGFVTGHAKSSLAARTRHRRRGFVTGAGLPLAPRRPVTGWRRG
jgi:hypothetical protein